MLKSVGNLIGSLALICLGAQIAAPQCVLAAGDDAPPRSANYFGTAHIPDGTDLPPGSRISAWQGDALLDETELFPGPEGGTFRLNVLGDILETPEIEGPDTGDLLRFEIDGAVVPEAGVWEESDHLRLDLTALIGPDLALAMDDGRDGVEPGQSFTYTFTVTNQGDANAPAVRLIADLPAVAGLVSASGGGARTGDVLRWPVFDLAAGAEATRTLTLALPASVGLGVEQVRVAAVVRSAGGLDPEFSNNTADDINRIDASPDVTVALDDQVEEAVPGDVLTYTLTVSNLGNQDAGSVTLVDLVPPGTTFLTASDDGIESTLGTISWPPFSLAAGQSVTRTLRLRVDGGGESIVNTASVGVGSEPDGDSQNNQASDTTRVRAVADLAAVAVRSTGAVADPQTLEVVGTATVEVLSSGTASAGAFEVTVFVDRDGDGVFSALDSVLGRARSSALPAGQSATITVDVRGVLPFVDAPLSTFIDSAAEVSELDEDNNTVRALRACEALPRAESFHPVLERSWPEDDANLSEPLSRESLSTPLVVQLTDDNGDGRIDADDVPDVVLMTANLVNPLEPKPRLRAIRGDSMRSIFDVLPPVSLGVLFSASSLAAGDIDGDGVAEILIGGLVPGGSPPNVLIAYEHDGTLKWISDGYSTHPVAGTVTNRDNPSIADLDGDGTAEIVVGANVFNADGTLRWAGTGGQGFQSASNRDDLDSGAISVVADLDQDGFSEIVTGNTLYAHDGTILWQIPDADGYPAVADFGLDGALDGTPEIVVVSRGQVRLHRASDGARIWGPVDLPGIGAEAGGAPAVADVDGDGLPEIAVAGSTQFTVFESDGTARWQRTVQDGSSNMTGATVFDLDGNGSAEVIYRDESFLRIYRGDDGTVLFEEAISSFTANEEPVVADVDGDGRAEILVTSDLATAVDTAARTFGLRVYGDAEDGWIGARKVWNQHAYVPEMIAEDGAIPARPAASWTTHNSFRANVVPEGGAAAPDLTAGFLRVDTSAYPRLLVRLRVGNAGTVPSLDDTPIAFRDGSGALLGVASVDALAPGEWPDAVFVFDSRGPGAARISARVSDDGVGEFPRRRECETLNNSHFLDYDTETVGLAVDLDNGAETVHAGDVVTFTATVINGGSESRAGIVVTHELPFGVSLVSASDGGVVDGGVLTWPAFSLPGASTTVRNLTVEVDAALPDFVRELVHSTRVVDDGALGPDPSPFNNTAIDVDRVLSVRADAGGPYVGVEGDTLTFDASASFDPAGSIVRHGWDFDGDGMLDSDSPVAEWTFVDDGEFPVRLEVESSTGEVDVVRVAALIANAPPVLETAPVDAAEGAPLELTLTFTDPGVLDVHTASITWGDGASEALAVAGGGGAGTILARHLYGAEGVYAAELCVRDGQAGTGDESCAEFPDRRGGLRRRSRARHPEPGDARPAPRRGAQCRPFGHAAGLRRGRLRRSRRQRHSRSGDRPGPRPGHGRAFAAGGRARHRADRARSLRRRLCRRFDLRRGRRGQRHRRARRDQ